MNAIDYFSQGGCELNLFYNIDIEHDSYFAFAFTKIIKKLSLGEFLGDTLVDVGSGPGNSLLAFAKKFPFKNLVAVDGAENMLYFIKNEVRFALSKEVSIHTHNIDLENEKLPIESESVGCVNATAITSYVKNPLNLLNETSRILKKNGIFTLSIEMIDTGETIKLPGNHSVSAFLHPQVMFDDFVSKQKFSILHHENRPLSGLGIETNLFVLQKMI